MSETYIGVSGVASPEQQAETELSFANENFSSGRRLLLGVKATTKIQVDELEPRKGRNWFPVGDELRLAMIPTTDSLKVLQLYADRWTDLNERVIPLIEISLERSQDWVDGIQYDLLPWFEEDLCLKLVERYAHGTVVKGPVILQCHGEIMRSHTPAEVVERLKRVEGYITHVLFDASEGRGITMNADTLSRWIDALRASGSALGVAVAGGLGSDDTESLIRPILRRFDNVSWDAESRLHTQNVLDSHAVSSYLKAGNNAIKIVEQSRAIANDIRTMGEWSIWLAHITRQPTYLDGRFENDAEHANMLTRVGLVIALKYFPELDPGKVAMYCTVHDDIEGYDGDFPSLGASPEAMRAKAQREKASIAKMKVDFADQPQYVALIEAYEQQSDPEARFVKILDKCLPAVMNLYNRGKSVAQQQKILTAQEYINQAKISSERLKGYHVDWEVMIESREALIEMIRTEVFDIETGEHLRRFETKKDE